ncbi:MAG: tRNA (cytidine(34)-2'-O)-methyltransferase [Myxococcota bacterium]
MFRVVLVEPEIPQNTGSIGRTCVATESPLHLIEPLGFSLEERRVRRAGLDYWSSLELHRHQSIEEYFDRHPGRFHLLTSRSETSYLDAAFQAGDALIFGKESVGLPETLVEKFPERSCSIPMPGPVRSLNLSNSVAIVLYEALRQLRALDTPVLR